MRPENLPAVLEVLHYGKEIRDEVARRFWVRLENTIKNCRPRGIRLTFTTDWEYKEHHSFGLNARVSAVPSLTQGLKYRLEACDNYIGIGLAWLKWKENNFEELSKCEPLVVMRAHLTNKRTGDLLTEPNQYWLWFEQWDVNLPIGNLWSWFAEKSDEAWFDDAGKKCWSFVEQSYPLAIKANEALAKGI